MSDHNETKNNQQHKKQDPSCFVWRTSTFVTINYEPIYSDKLSSVAKALWTFGHAHAPGWKFYFSEISKHFKEGERSLYRAFNELVSAGLAARFQYRKQSEKSKRWQFSGCHYIFFQEVFNSQQIKDIEVRFKKSCSHDKIEHPQNDDLQFGRLIDIIDNSNKEENTYAPSSDDASDASFAIEDRKEAKKPDMPKKQQKQPFKTSELKERLSGHDSKDRFFKAYQKPLVGLSDEHYQELITKYGLNTTNMIIQHLGEWKLSKAEVSPGEVNKHGDYYRIKKWVAKAVLESDTNESNGAKISKNSSTVAIQNHNLAHKIKERFAAHPDLIDVTEDYIQFNNKGANARNELILFKAFDHSIFKKKVFEQMDIKRMRIPDDWR